MFGGQSTRTSKQRSQLVQFGLVAACASCNWEVPQQQPTAAQKPQQVADALAGPGYSEMPYSQGVYFGTGLNIITEEALTAADCIQRGQDYDYFMSHVPQKTEYYYQLIKSKTELRDHIGINARIELDISALSGHIAGEYMDHADVTSNAVYAIIKLERTFRDISLRDPELTPGARELFERPDVEEFRRACGDRFLNVITTGGRFYGILEVQSKSTLDKSKIAAELKAELKSIKLTVEGRLDLSDSKIDERFDMRIYYISEGAAGLTGMVNNFATFAENFHTFKSNLEKMDAGFGRILDDPTIDPNSTEYKIALQQAAKHGINVKFDEYATLNPEVMQGGDQKKHAEIMDEYCALTDGYTKITEQIEERQLRSHAYVGMTTTSVQRAMAALKKDMEEYKRIIKRLARRCAASTNRVCIDVRDAPILQEQELIHPNDLFEQLPEPKPLFPRTCDEIEDNFTFYEDINALYVGGDRFKPYFAVCVGFGQEDTDERDFPEEYLLLYAKSPLGTNPRYNYSQYVAYPKDGVPGTLQTETLTSVYSALRVNDFTYGLSVYPDQQAFVESVGKARHGDDVMTQAMWGTSRSCASTVQQAANVDLSGTPFRLAHDFKFEADNDQYVVVEQPMTWSNAAGHADQLGGSLLSIYSETDNGSFQRVLDENVMPGSWLGLMYDRFVGGAFEWYPSKNFTYRNWAVQPEFAALGQLACGYMDTATGQWHHTNCWRTKKPFIVEFKKIVGAAIPAEIPTDCEEVCIYELDPDKCSACKTLHSRQVYDLRIGSKMPGTCGAFGSIGEVVLVYNRNIAMQHPELAPYFEEYPGR